MVMEATPSPQSVGREFVRQYYTLLNKAPAHLHRFYNNYSSFVHGGLDAPNRETLPVIGQKQIHNRIQQLNFRDCHAKISQVDSQATLGNGVVVQVTGELSNGGAPMRRFTQTFVLAAQSPKKYYVHNDIFRYQDIVFSDEESEGACAEEEGGFFPTAPTATTPAPFPVSAPSAPPHINGHPDPIPEQIVTGLQNTSISLGNAPSPTPEQVEEIEPLESPVPEPEPEPEEEPEVVPPPTPPEVIIPTVASPPEPKTYANLLKSGTNVTANVVYNPPQPQRPPRTSSNRNEMSPPENSRKYLDNQQLFLGNLPPNATEDDLRALFGRFGAIAELRIHGKGGGSRHNNYGFITYEEPQAAHNCLNATLYFPPDALDGAGTKLNVEEKRPRTGSRPDRPDRGERGERGERGGRGRRPPFGSSRPPNSFSRR